MLQKLQIVLINEMTTLFCVNRPPNRKVYVCLLNELSLNKYLLDSINSHY